jgi:acid phosphatase family membrane protein YuiD
VIPFNPPFTEERAYTAVVLSWFIAQVAKLVRGGFRSKRSKFRWIFDTGGMPSAHSATVSCLTTVTGLYFGFDSLFFLIVLIFSLITMFDAAGVRRSVGRQAVVLNKMLDEFSEKGHVAEQRLKELLGHTPFEVFAGAFLGVTVAYLLCGL